MTNPDQARLLWCLASTPDQGFVRTYIVANQLLGGKRKVSCLGTIAGVGLLIALPGSLLTTYLLGAGSGR
ncbi:MAG: hypothetical protein V2A73_17095 [Pseudomonadota bacterium]